MEGLAYRYYFTELVRLQAQGQTFGVSFYDFIHPRHEHVEDRTAEEIVSDVVARAGLEVTE